MTRTPAIFLAALIALAVPAGAASAQDPGPRRDRDRGAVREEQRRPERPSISYAEAASIARSRAGDARWVGYQGFENNQYVFTFERERGQIIYIRVPANR